MGREIKRVSLKFDWFERHGNKTWEGYLLDEIECPLCSGTGRNVNDTNECKECYGEGKTCPTVEPLKDYGDENGPMDFIWILLREDAQLPESFVEVISQLRKDSRFRSSPAHSSPAQLQLQPSKEPLYFAEADDRSSLLAMDPHDEFEASIDTLRYVANAGYSEQINALEIILAKEIY